MDTSDEESDSQAKNSQRTLNITNGSTVIQKFEISSVKNNENPRNNICFNDWNIKKSDLLPFQEKSIFDEFTLSVRALRMGRYLNLHKEVNRAKFTNDQGVNIKLLGKSNLYF